MFTVELPGYGVVRDPGFPPYPVYVISVQQPLQTWTCYRRHSSFKSLGEHLASSVPGIGKVPHCPKMDDEVKIASSEQLDKARVLLQQWLHQTLLCPGVKESQVLRNFLCANANMPPPCLEITWVKNYNPSLDEMEMDELFDRQVEDRDPDASDSDGDDDVAAGRGYSFDGVGSWRMEYGASGGPRGHHGGVAPALGAVNYADMPTEDDIASSVPVEISFKDPRLSAQRQLAEEEEQQKMQAQSKPKVNLNSFKMIRVIGKGSFGKVFLVREKVSGQLYAMKVVLRKDNIIKRNQVEHTKTERNVLGYVKHPFIVGLNMAFQTRDKLFFVLDYCAGGELFFHLGKLGKFPGPRARFYAAEIALALQYVHTLDIVYRDLKPENVLLNDRGHIRLTDFGLSKEGISDNTSGAHSFCGTPEYLAPEILNRQGHGRAVDWWSLGALLYEMLTGLPPFYCRDREKLFEKIRRGNLAYPRYLSDQATDILQGLLTRDPAKRLGSGPDDTEEIKRHPFFSGVDWERMSRCEIDPPWMPPVVGSLDTSQFDHEFTTMPLCSPDTRSGDFKLCGTSHDNTFEGFSFVDRGGFMAQANRLPEGEV
ncbi:unnamed protein product [Chrysoparadoxa australica]